MKIKKGMRAWRPEYDAKRRLLTPAQVEQMVLYWLEQTEQYHGQPIVSSIADFANITTAEARDAAARLAERGRIRVDGPCLGAVRR